MSVKLRKRKRSGNKYSLFLDIYNHGERGFEYLNMFLVNDKKLDKATLKLAEDIRAKRQLEQQSAAYGFVSETRRKDNFVEYFEKLVNERPEDRTSWKCTLLKLKSFSNGSIAFQNITPEWLNELKKYILSKVSQITAWHYYSNIKYALNKAVKEKIIPSNPAILVENIKKPESKREYLTFEEVKKLKETYCIKSVKDAFIFSCFTGLRYSDVRNLKWENVREDRIEFKQQKTQTQEYLPLSKTALSILNSRRNTLNESEYVFNLPTKAVILEHIKKWVKNAKINKRVSFHTARHTFATLSLTQGIDLYTVSKLLGHKDISTTQVYAKIIDSKKQEAIQKLPTLEI
jgi:integrase